MRFHTAIAGHWLTSLHKKLNGSPILLPLVRQDSLQNFIDIMGAAPAERDGERRKFRIAYKSVMYLLKGFRDVALAQKKVSKAPCCLCGNRIELARLSKCLLRLGDAACCFICAGEIHPVKRRARIDGRGTLIIRDR